MDDTDDEELDGLTDDDIYMASSDANGRAEQTAEDEVWQQQEEEEKKKQAEVKEEEEKEKEEEDRQTTAGVRTNGGDEMTQ